MKYDLAACAFLWGVPMLTVALGLAFYKFLEGGVSRD